MADPTDPQTAALANIQNAGRTYNRGRRRGAQANMDPAFLAAVETTDPAARREALAAYARSRASALFPGGQEPPNGRDVVAQAFPQGNAFAPVERGAAPLPSQADVMSQVAPRRAVPMGQRMDEARAKMAEEAANPMPDEMSPGEGMMEPEPGESMAHESAEPVEEPSGIDRIGAAAENIRRTIQARRGR